MNSRRFATALAVVLSIGACGGSEAPAPTIVLTSPPTAVLTSPPTAVPTRTPASTPSAIPTPARTLAPTSTPAPPLTYLVLSPVTWDQVAELFGISVVALVNANLRCIPQDHVGAPQIGQILALPPDAVPPPQWTPQPDSDPSSAADRFCGATPAP